MEVCWYVVVCVLASPVVAMTLVSFPVGRGWSQVLCTSPRAYPADVAVACALLTTLCLTSVAHRRSDRGISGAVDGLLPSGTAASILSRSGLPEKAMRDIWAATKSKFNTGNPKSMTESEFVHAATLVSEASGKSLQQNNFSI